MKSVDSNKCVKSIKLIKNSKCNMHNNFVPCFTIQLTDALQFS